MNRMRKLALDGILIVGMTLLFTFGLAEIAGRLAGKGVWTVESHDLHEPTLFEYDRVLGWRNKAGRYVIPPYTPEGKAFRISHWSGGLRATAPVPRTRPGKLVLLGDSCTHGWAVSDEETYGWKLQARTPSLQVLNLGTPAYGTYQSLLALERYFASGGKARIVLYGFLDFHEARNLGDREFLRSLSLYSHRKHVYVPYVTLGTDGALVRHAPERYPDWPLKQWLVSVRLLESAYARLRLRRDTTTGFEVTRRLVASMRAVAEKNGARFAVVGLGYPGAAMQRYLDTFRRDRVETLDCVEPFTPERTVKGDGHPNGVLHSRWADCIARGLASRWGSDFLAE